MTACLAGCLAVLILRTGRTRVCFDSRCFKIETALTFHQRAVGLSQKESMDTDKAMLFIFEKEGYHSFWMKDMSFALDIIWLDSSKTVVEVKRNVQPCVDTCPSLTPRSKSKYVLEVVSGEAETIEVGDRMRFSLFKGF